MKRAVVFGASLLALVVLGRAGFVELRHQAFADAVGTCCPPEATVVSVRNDWDGDSSYTNARGRCLGVLREKGTIAADCKSDPLILFLAHDLRLIAAIREHMAGESIPWDEVVSNMAPANLRSCRPEVVSVVLREWARQLASGLREPNVDSIVEIGGIGALYADLLVRRGESSLLLREAFVRSGGDPSPFDRSRSFEMGAILARINQMESSRRLDMLLETLRDQRGEVDVDGMIQISSEVIDLDVAEIERRFNADVVGSTKLTREETLLARLYVGLVAHGKGREVPTAVKTSLPLSVQIEIEHVAHRRRIDPESLKEVPFVSFHWVGRVQHEASRAWIAEQSPRRRAHLLCEDITGWRRWFDL